MKSSKDSVTCPLNTIFACIKLAQDHTTQHVNKDGGRFTNPHAQLKSYRQFMTAEGGRISFLQG